MNNSAWLPRIAFVTVSVAVLAFHVLWVTQFPEIDSAQQKWMAVPSTVYTGWATAYVSRGSFWLGFSFAVSLGFAAYALTRFLRNSSKAAGRLALTGIGLSGILSILGCFLIGCCGSPMLGVYLSLFGASFLPFAKPLVAAVTAIFIALSWWRLRLTGEPTVAIGECTDSSCKCEKDEKASQFGHNDP